MKLGGAPIAFGLALVIAVMAATLAIALSFGAEAFPTIRDACLKNDLAPQICFSGARAIGIETLIAYGLCLALGSVLGWFVAPAPPPPRPASAEPTPLTALFLAAALAVFVAHAGVMVAGPAWASRTDEARAYADLISLENLILPLLLQLWLSAPAGALRRALFAGLLMAMSLSPYRAMLLAIFGFGFLLPLGLEARDWFRAAAPARPSPRPLLARAALTLGFAAVLTVSGYIDTEMRSPSLLVDPASATRTVQRYAEAPLVPADPRRASDAAPGAGAQATPPLRAPHDVVLRLAQRAVFPLYQAAIAGHVIETTPVPGLVDLVLRKFRLGDAPALEEFLFRRIYGGTTRNEVTSLTYGEAKAYFPGPPLVWMTLLPMGLVMAWRGLARRGLDGGTLLGMTIWRSSFSGLLPVLPAMLLQLGGLVVITRFRPPWLAAPRIATLARALLVTGLAAALIVECWTIAATRDRRSILIARYEIASTCSLVSRSWVTPHILRSTTEIGRPLQAVLAAATRTSAILALPYGRSVAPQLPIMAAAIAASSTCPDRAEKGHAPVAAVTLVGTEFFSHPINPLDVLTALALALALVSSLPEGLKRRFRRAGGP